ncbi:MAG: SRPBCC family protein, partial [Actinomycetota bacterium]|nr:SRPBCC family protein [Actinomycetota bacterium]
MFFELDGAPPRRHTRDNLGFRRCWQGYPGCVAVLNVLIDRDPKQVWDVLSDGWAYAEWVVGTKDIRKVDRDWPAEGSQIHYTVGFGRWTAEDVTT